MTVTLGLGMHYTPSWVTSLPDSTYVDEHGNVSGEADLVFSQRVRDAAATYFQHVSSVVDFSKLTSVRLTSGGDAEMLYPSASGYWAFSPGAQNGSDQPRGMAPNPLPGWVPGTRGQSQTAMAQWLRWYVDGLDNVAAWQMAVLRDAGFAGQFQMITPGSGMRPDGVANLLSNNLPDSLAGVGAVWSIFYNDLPKVAGIEAYVSSVADGSGSDDSCRSTDTSVAVTSATADSWSATRWIARLAAASGLPIGGENPGYTDSMARHYDDPSSTGLMATSVRQVTSCGFSDFYWAHDERLWNGSVALSQYAADVAPAAGATPTPTPTPTATPTPTSSPTHGAHTPKAPHHSHRHAARRHHRRAHHRREHHRHHARHRHTRG
jgi:hypothetical protein